MKSKRLWILLFCITLLICFCTTVSAELTPVNAKLQKDLKKGISTFALSDVNAVTSFENDILKVDITDTKFDWFLRGSLGNMRANFKAMHTDGIYHATQAAFGGSVRYLSATGIVLNFTNKSDADLYIDLNQSQISIGEYIGRPITQGVRYSDIAGSSLSPIILKPEQSLSKTLLRADYYYVDDGDYFTGYVVPCDLSLGKNIYGDGTFIFAVGENDTQFISMNFYREIDKNSITQYISQK